MDLLIWILGGVALALLATVLVLLVRLGDERDKLQRARSDLGVFQTARADYEGRLKRAEADRDSARARVAELNARLKMLADDAEYKDYLKTTHQLLVDFRDVRQAANELDGLRVRVENQRRQLQERGGILQDHISLQEARHALTREQEDFEAKQRMTHVDHERKVDQLQRANQDQIDALKQTHALELQMVQRRLDARLAALGPRTAEVEKKEQELVHRAEVLKRQSAGLDSRYEGLSRQMQDLQTSKDRVAADLKKTLDSFAALGRTLEGDGLVCVEDWRTYKPDQVTYLPRLVVNPMLEEKDRGRRPYADAIRLTETTLSEWIRRERPELQTREQKLGALFEPKCVVADHAETLLPRATQWVVPIIGGTSAGKTLYVTALIRELRRQLPRGYGFQCEPADTLSLRNFTELRKSIFDEGKIRPTASGEKKDMIYRVTPNDQENPRRLTMFFRDIAGEYWQQRLQTDPEEHGHFLLAAPCIMMLIDPLADPQLRSAIKATVGEQGFGDFSHLPTPEEIMTSVTLFLRRHGGYENTVIPKDLLMVLTKADLLDDILFRTGDPVREPITSARPFPAYRIDQRSDSIEAKLRAHDALGGVIDSLPAQYKSVRWFAASAVGFPLKESYQRGEPTAVDLKNTPAPKNVIDPILHSMWLSGLLT